MEYNDQGKLNKWRVVACEALERANETQDELATLRAENERLREVIEDLPDYIEAFRAFKDKGCKSRRDYAQVVEDIVGIAREAKEALK